MKKSEIRLMKEADAAQMAVLEKKYFSTPWSEKSILDSFRLDNYIFVVAQRDESIVGYCALYTSFDEGDITNVVTDEAVRRQGVANEMLEFLFLQARNRGVKTVLLEARLSNEGAIALYKKIGFEECGIRKGFYEKPVEDALIMKIDLE